MLSVVNGPTDNETQAVPGGGQCLRSADIDDSTAPNFTALADAAALGVSALAGVVAGARDGITIVDADRRFVYANPVACEMLGYSLAELGGRDFLDSIPVREHAVMLARFAGKHAYSTDERSAPFSCSLRRPDGTEREIVYSQFTVDVHGRPHGVALFEDLTGPRAASRAAVALVQTVSQLAGPTGAEEILTDIARRAVDGTRAAACGLATVNDDRTLGSAGGYGLTRAIDDAPRTSLERAFAGIAGDDVIEAMTAGGITVGEVPRRPVVLSNARSVWQADPVTRPFAAMVSGLDWEAGVYVPLSWQNRVIGVLAVYLPPGLAGPSEAELAFYTALADQATVALINSRLNTDARREATSVERARLARELHDSVSQGLFSMTMQARAAQLSIARSGLEENGPLGRSIAELAGLSRGALAEMRAMIFELRPAALAEEGLMAALRKQAAALSAREQSTVTVHGPEARLDLKPEVEEHVYRITSEALHAVINHAGVGSATVSVTEHSGALRTEVRDDGTGFDQGGEHPGLLRLREFGERAESTGVELAITSRPGDGTTITVSLPVDKTDPEQEISVGDQVGRPSVRNGDRHPGRTERAALSGFGRQPAEGGANDEPGRSAPELAGSRAVAAATSLGVTALAGVLAGAREGIAISDASGCFVYVNPSACRMLDRSLQELRGLPFLSVIPEREHEFRLGRFSDLRGGAPARYSGTLVDSKGGEHEAVYSTFPVEIGGSPHTVAFVRDVTNARAAARAGAALAQATSQLVSTGATIDEVLAGIARHAVEGTRAVACGFEAAGMAEGGYGPGGETHGDDRVDGWKALEAVPVADRIEAFTSGSIMIGDVAGQPVVVPDARSVWETNPVLNAFVATMGDWRGTAVFVPMAWETRVFGWTGVFLEPGVAGPSEAELAFFTALTDQAAVAVTNARLAADAKRAATSLERTRLARELHDSVSQALFSMTMQARAAQLSMKRAGLDESGPLGRSIAELAELTRGALAEMRALIFELRPAALGEAGLVTALRMQAAALTARGQVTISVEGPDRRLDLKPGVEEHLYRIASEALQNVVNHARAERATVRVGDQAGVLRVAVNDDGAGFDPARDRPGHLGLGTMAERADAIGAKLTVTSAPGEGTTVMVSLAGDRTERQAAPNGD